MNTDTFKPRLTKPERDMILADLPNIHPMATLTTVQRLAIVEHAIVCTLESGKPYDAEGMRKDLDLHSRLCGVFNYETEKMIQTESLAGCLRRLCEAIDTEDHIWDRKDDAEQLLKRLGYSK